MKIDDWARIPRFFTPEPGPVPPHLQSENVNLQCYYGLVAEAHHHPKPSAGALRETERSRLAWVMVISGVTMLAEVAGGYWSGSIALLGDAFHMLTHFVAMSLSWGAIVIAMRPAPPEKTYRNWRLEVLASLVNGIALLPIAGVVLYTAVDRWRNPVDIKVGWMLGVGAIGLAVNILSAWMLHRPSRQDLNVRGAFFHMLSDTISSVGVIAAGVLIWLTGWHQADPLIAGGISILIVGWCISLVRSSGRILMETAPGHLDLEEVRATLMEVDGVEDIHDLHVWTITSRMHALTAHVRVAEDLRVSEAEAIGARLEGLLDERHGINHATFQFEVGHRAALECEHDVGARTGD